MRACAAMPDLRGTAYSRVDALRELAFPIVQAGIAAAIAWTLAHDAIGHKRAFFAPIAALIALGVAASNRTRRVVELTLGVAVGIGVGDLLIYGIGSGAWQVGVVVVLAMASAVLLGGGPLFVSQAASSAVLVATLAPSGLNGSRFVDALVGGAVGLAVVVALPLNPLRRARDAGAPVFAELAGTLDDVADALEHGDVAAAREALARARASDPAVARWRATLEMSQETARLSPPYWRARTQLDRYVAAAAQVELAVRNTRVLARSAIRATELEGPLAGELPPAVRALALAVREVGAALDGRADGSEAVAAAVAAAAHATHALDARPSLSIAHVVGQVRSTSTDLLRALGVDDRVAVDRVRGAAERVPD
jgi:uncharacterized membrane protein YgaE (UPF0421/DUF939 family)